MKALITAAILTHTVNRQKTAIKLKRGKKSEVKKRDASLPNSYPGISKNGIAKILNCSPSQAVKLKGSAIKAGYLKAVKHEQVLLQMDKPDYHLRGQLKDLFPKWTDKIFFRRNLITGMIELFRQLCDELVPLVNLKRYGKTYRGIRTPSLRLMPAGLSMAV